MPYLLDALFPGFGHLAARAYGSAILILFAWMLSFVSIAVVGSFDPLWFWGGVGTHCLWAMVGCIHLRILKTRENPGPARLVLLWLSAPLLVGVLCVATTTYLVRPIKVQSGSMMPAIRTGHVILGQLFWPRIGSLSLGDIIVVAHPERAQVWLIKRILGLEGDVIEVRSGELYRNGRALSQCRLRNLRDPETNQRAVERLEVLDQHPYLVWDQPAFVATSFRAEVPTGHIFVIGDNRDRSGDSRTFGTVPVENVRGRVVATLFPSRPDAHRAPLEARTMAYRRCSGRSGR